jgi:hypothetical protein
MDAVITRPEPQAISQIREQFYVLNCVSPDREKDGANAAAGEWASILDAYDRKVGETLTDSGSKRSESQKH